MPAKQFRRGNTLDAWKQEARFWERRSNRNRRYLEQALIALNAGDQDGLQRILTRALSLEQETKDLD